MIDPHWQKEAKTYKNPIASRQLILSLIAKKPCSKKQLIKQLKIPEHSKKALNLRLSAMVRDKELSCNRKGQFCLFNEKNVMTGTISANRRGFGFVVLDSGARDLRLSKKQMALVFHGDKVRVRLLARRNSPLDAEIVAVLEKRKQLVGVVLVEQARCYLMPDDRRILQRIYLPNEKVADYKKTQLVLVNIDEYPSEKMLAKASVVEHLGGYLSAKSALRSAIYRFQIPFEFSKAVEKEARVFAENVSEKDIANRLNLSDLPFVTIDGSDAKDFDDAVCAIKTEQGFRLWVAIADVAHYVTKESALDETAYQRGNSVYFANSVVPMLPEVLSNHLCSLKEKVPRLALNCQMDIDNKGCVTHYVFNEVVINSKARLTYQQVETFLKQNQSVRLNPEVTLSLKTLSELAKLLKKQRLKQGSIEFDLRQEAIVFDKNQKVSAVVSQKRLFAHQLIEECMLVANQSAANFLSSHQTESLYRVHPKPKADKIKQNALFLKAFNLPVFEDGLDCFQFQQVLMAIKKRKDAAVVQSILLRLMQQAYYTAKAEPHFGLAFERYVHFTSPIRRYPDLIVHRSIKDYLQKQTPAYNHQQLLAIGAHCSTTERRADEATRDVMQFLKCLYMQERVGQVVTGTVTMVSHFGLFVELTDYLVEGLLAVQTMDDYFIFDEQRFCLSAQNSKRRYQLGDCLSVRITDIVLTQRQIHLSLA